MKSSVANNDLTNAVRSLLGQICPKKDVDFLVEWLEKRQSQVVGKKTAPTDAQRQSADQLRALLGCTKVRFISRRALKEHGVEPHALVEKSFRLMCGTKRLSDLGEMARSRIRATAIHLGGLRKDGLDQADIDIVVDFIIASSTGDAFASTLLEASMTLLPEARPIGTLASGGPITGITKDDRCLGILV